MTLVSRCKTAVQRDTDPKQVPSCPGSVSFYLSQRKDTALKTVPEASQPRGRPDGSGMAAPGATGDGWGLLPSALSTMPGTLPAHVRPGRVTA